MPSTRGWRLVLARRAGVPASVRRFAKRARQRRLRMAAPWLAALLAVVLAAAGAGVIFGTSVLGVARVRVVGSAAVPPDAVLLAAGVRLGTPLARLNPDAIERRVERLPPIRQASVVRDWPDMLVIQVRERSPVAVVPQTGGYTLLDESGVAYLPVATRPAGLPVVRLAAPDPADRTTRAALRVLAALPPVLRQPLVALVADAPTRIRLVLPDDRVIIWGDDTENEAKARVATSLLSNPARVLDVSAPAVATVR